MDFFREISIYHSNLFFDFVSVQEAALFFAKTAAERTPLGVRQSIENEGKIYG